MVHLSLSAVRPLDRGTGSERSTILSPSLKSFFRLIQRLSTLLKLSFGRALHHGTDLCMLDSVLNYHPERIIFSANHNYENTHSY